MNHWKELAPEIFALTLLAVVYRMNPVIGLCEPEHPRRVGQPIVTADDIQFGLTPA